MKRKTPYISIIIISNNDINSLSACLNSLNNLNNIEIIIVNNYSTNRCSTEMSNFLNELNDKRIIFYQSNIELSRNALRNLAISFSSGNWLFLIKDTDIVFVNFVKFLEKSKFNPQTHFYRFSKIAGNNKKEKFKLFQSKKYFSMNIDTFLINGEWLRNIGYQFHNNLEYGTILPFINYLYNYKNVNFTNIKKMYGVHNQVLNNSYRDDFKILFYNLHQTTEALLNYSRRNYKQFLILLYYDVYKKRFSKEKENSKIFFNGLSKMIIDSKIKSWNYLNFGLFFYLKTFAFRYKILFSKMKISNQKKTNSK